MPVTDEQVEDRLRRTFAAVATAEPGPVPWEVARGRRSVGRMGLVAAAAAVMAITSAVVVVQRRDGTSVTTSPPAAGPGEGRALDSYRPSQDEADLLFRAEQRLLATCMRAKGQPFEEIPPLRDDDLDRYWSRLGRTDAARARQLGYLATARPGPGGTAGPYPGTLPEAAKQAWSEAFDGGRDGGEVPVIDPRTGETTGGQSAGGCLGEMNRALYGDQARHTSLAMFVANVAAGEVDAAVQAEPRLAAAIESWSRCMGDHGHDYAHPFDPVNAFNSPDKGTRDPSEAEQATAVVDVECKEVSGLLATYRDIEAAHSRAVAARYAPYLTEYREMVDAALDRARRLPADG